MSAISDYRGLTVWQEALALAELVYAATRRFPGHERFGLTSQLRRAVVSIPSCIAEGNARSSTRDYLRFLSMASGSLAEVETQVVLAGRFGYLLGEEGDALMRQLRLVQKLLRAMKQSLDRREAAFGAPFPVPRSRRSR